MCPAKRKKERTNAGKNREVHISLQQRLPEEMSQLNDLAVLAAEAIDQSAVTANGIRAWQWKERNRGREEKEGPPDFALASSLQLQTIL